MSTRPNSVAVIGLQWGDEGKGKISHYLSDQFDVFVRFQGGGNAGHTIYHEGQKVVTHLLPVGIVHKDKVCVLANGMVLNPDALIREIDDVSSILGESAWDLSRRIFISNKAHVVTQGSLDLDVQREETQKLGTTKTGIGPTYESKVNRTGTTVGHVLQENAFANAEFLRLFRDRIVNTEVLLSGADRIGQKIFFEGAQGVLLDVDLGQYPFVTSSNCLPAAIGTGAGFPVSKVERIIGVTKPYSTRVGAGPFTSEMTSVESDAYRDLGSEFGATTGRPRRCGWLDAFALKYAVEVAGVTEIAVTKMDILDGNERVPVCVGYMLDGSEIRNIFDFPYGKEWDRVEPIFEYWTGWDNKDEHGSFLFQLSVFVGASIKNVSYGPEPEATSGF